MFQNLYFVPIGGYQNSEGDMEAYYADLTAAEYILYELEQKWPANWESLPPDMKEWLEYAVETMAKNQRIDAPN